MSSLRLIMRHARFLSSSPLNRPAPPPLPPREQREFEELVRAASAPAATTNFADASEGVTLAARRISKGEELHPDARRPPPPEFEGDTNPVTGEVGGPKREPLRHGDWSYGGRTSDF